MLSLTLRRASTDDAYALWIWANDAATREASGNRDAIAWQDHVQWLQRLLSSDSAVLFIAEAPQAQPVGYARFETSDGWGTARLSYAVAPEARRLGYGSAVVRQGLVELTRLHRCTRIRADVMTHNRSSCKILENLGWTAEPLPDGIMSAYWMTLDGIHDHARFDHNR